jgi:hypothetical protein
MYMGQVVRQIEMHTTKPFVSEPSAAEAATAIRKLKRYKSPSVYQSPSERIQAEGETLHLDIHKFIKFIRNKELPHQWKESVFSKRMIKINVVIIKAYHCCQLHTKFYQTFFSLG